MLTLLQHHARSIAIGLIATSAALLLLALLLATKPALLAIAVGVASLGGILAIAAAITQVYSHRPLAETELESARRAIEASRKELAQEKQSLDELRNSAAELLGRELSDLDRRQQEFGSRLATFHEWMEFPQPITLVADQPIETVAAEQKVLVEKDRQLSTLLKEETKILYDNILSNKYVIEGRINVPAVRNDVQVLAEKVAKIYQPEISQPLLETSLSRVLKALSRTSLQTLVVLDSLPLQLQHQSFGQLHGYLRSAVQAYRVYKSSEPYWPYVNTAYYLSRMAMGANPLTLSAWWLVGTIGKQGAAAVATRLVNHHALKFLSDIVRVIGYEVAALYSPEFRYRDPNWIYAAELTSLVASFPLSRDGLARSMQEIGSLELRSEYDRIFFYRALAAHQSGLVREYVSAGMLSSEHRRAIASRLERFFEHHVHGKTPDRVKKWKQGVEERLGIKLLVSSAQSGQSVNEQVVSAIRGLASFLLAVKLLEPQELRPLLASTRLIGLVASDMQTKVLDEIESNPPYFLEHPDLDVDGDLPRKFVEDLAMLHARTAPRSIEIEVSIVEMATYLRLPAASIQTAIEKHLLDQFVHVCGEIAGVKKPPVAVARAVLDLMAGSKQLTLLYGNATIDRISEVITTSEKAGTSSGEYWLTGRSDELWLIEIGANSRIVWKSDSSVTAQAKRNYLSTTCQITGGLWLDGETFVKKPWNIELAAGMLSSFQSYFGPLLDRWPPRGTQLARRDLTE